MSLKVAINGFGRIGRNFYRASRKRGADFDVVAANDIGDPKTMAHLLKYDSVLGPLDDEVKATNGGIRVGDDDVLLLSERDPADLPWKDLGVQVVIESTGLFQSGEKARAHLDAGADKVVISAPATEPDVTIVLGVNDDDYDKDKHDIISMASCTTNCVAPLAKVLNDEWGIKSGFMTTIHAYTNDQQILDLPHKDLRRARAAAMNLIPTTTGAARAIGLVIPELQGKVDGVAVRAPVPDGSVVDLTAHVDGNPSADEVNAKFKEAADNGNFEGILHYSDDPLVSSDIIGSSYSSVFDSQLTMAHEGEVKVFSWYDNEWGYSCRLVDIVSRLL